MEQQRGTGSGEPGGAGVGRDGEQAPIAGLLEFLQRAAALETQYRGGFTSDGRPESVAEHSWRVCLLATVLTAQQGAGELDVARLMRMCVVHDLGEALGGDVPATCRRRAGDVPAPEQARRRAAGEATGKGSRARVSPGADRVASAGVGSARQPAASSRTNCASRSASASVRSSGTFVTVTTCPGRTGSDVS